MVCPHCGSTHDKHWIKDSRPIKETNAVRRRRECEVCHKRFTTQEVIVSDYDKAPIRERWDDPVWLLNKAGTYARRADALMSGRVKPVRRGKA